MTSTIQLLKIIVNYLYALPEHLSMQKDPQFVLHEPLQLPLQLPLQA